MKINLIFATCLLSLQIVKAHSLPPVDSSVRLSHSGYSDRSLRDTNFSIPVTSYSGSIFKLRLDSIQKDVPLDYNEYVQNYIDLYTRHKDEMSHVLGLAKYYFPIYERIFREAGIPVEIKYLSIVESKLDPNAVSRVGATGPWQFMATTAKIYGLNMDSYIDERRDPIQASYAAAAYLKDAYQEFGDWLLAIASYNCGKSNVEHAIQKAGAMDFWAIRQYLPAETRNYVPAYIAVSYVMNYAAKHNIPAEGWNYSARTDTLMVNRMIEMNNVAQALNVNINDLALLNPSYKRQVINGTPAAPRRLIVPSTDKKNYPALYNVLNGIPNPVTLTAPPPALAVTLPPPIRVPAPVRVQPAPMIVQTPAVQTPAAKTSAPAVTTPVVIAAAKPKTPDFYIVQEGDTLENIAAANGLEVREIVVWNHLQTGQPAPGKKLKLNPFAKLSKG